MARRLEWECSSGRVPRRARRTRTRSSSGRRARRRARGAAYRRGGRRSPSPTTRSGRDAAARGGTRRTRRTPAARTAPRGCPGAARRPGPPPRPRPPLRGPARPDRASRPCRRSRSDRNGTPRSRAGAVAPRPPAAARAPGRSPRAERPPAREPPRAASVHVLHAPPLRRRGLLELAELLRRVVAAPEVPGLDLLELGLLLVTDVADVAGAARVEDAAGGRVRVAGDLAAKPDARPLAALLLRHAGQQRLRVRVMRRREDRLGAPELHQPAEVEDRDPIGPGGPEPQ